MSAETFGDDSEPSNLSQLPLASGSPSSDEDRNADRRDARSRSRILRRLFDELGISPPLAEEITADLASLLPPKHRMSQSGDVADRLKSLLERDAKAPPTALMSSTGVELDVASEGTIRSIDRLAEFVKDGDEKLLQAYVGNERLRGVLAAQLAEQDAVRRVLIAELARRYTLTEQWRYKIPKALMPVIAVFITSGVRRDKMRPGSPLLKEVIDLVSRYSPVGKTTPEALDEAARNAEQQFDNWLPDEINEGADDPETPQVLEDIYAAQHRLNQVVNPLRIAFRQCVDEAAKSVTKKRLDEANLLVQMGAGLDVFGRPVFESIDEFIDALDYIKKKGLL